MSSVLSCVMVKTKTRSKNSSSVETRSALSLAASASGLGALPVTKGSEQFVTRVGRYLRLAKGPHGQHRVADLFDVRHAARAEPEVFLESRALRGSKGIFQIIGDELNELLAAHTASRYCSSARLTLERARCRSTR